MTAGFAWIALGVIGLGAFVYGLYLKYKLTRN